MNVLQMKEETRMAKPDNRADNVENLQENVQNTIENLEESKSYLNEHGDEIPQDEAQQLKEKNQRREESIEGFRQEIKDEAQANPEQL
jgi:small acid-soluble spore protein (thioredoxin-like protein)